MSTPAEELGAAADKLDALTSGVTEGPWRTFRELDGIFAGQWTVVKAGGLRVASVGQTRRHHAQDAEGNVAYIAAMNPLVGKALAELLRRQAEQMSRLPVDTQVFICDREHGGYGHGLAIARLINAS